MSLLPGGNPEVSVEVAFSSIILRQMWTCKGPIFIWPRVLSVIGVVLDVDR